MENLSRLYVLNFTSSVERSMLSITKPAPADAWFWIYKGSGSHQVGRAGGRNRRHAQIWDCTFVSEILRERFNQKLLHICFIHFLLFLAKLPSSKTTLLFKALAPSTHFVKSYGSRTIPDSSTSSEGAFPAKLPSLGRSV